MRNLNIELPIEQPDYATIHKSIGVVDEIELSFCDDYQKTIFKLRLFDKKRAQIEEVRLIGFDKVKNQYNDLVGSKFTQIDGIKNIKNIISQFTEKARTITFNDMYSNYCTDVFYK